LRYSRMVPYPTFLCLFFRQFAKEPKQEYKNRMTMKSWREDDHNTTPWSGLLLTAGGCALSFSTVLRILDRTWPVLLVIFGVVATFAAAIIFLHAQLSKMGKTDG